MRNALFTVKIGGDNPIYAASMRTYEEYCQKYDLDLIVATQPRINWQNVYFERLQVLDHLDKYRQVAVVDLDILVTPTARNIFHHHSDPTRFYALHENLDYADMNRDPWIDGTNPKIPWPVEHNGRRRYFNTGVYVLSSISAGFLRDHKDALRHHSGNLWVCGDQTYLNCLSVERGASFSNLEYAFNRMHLGKADPERARYKADFIHYAGLNKYGTGPKVDIVLEDYMNLYG